ncbi:MAG: FtsX-like permease family protein [Planctomycetaceae bacterium]
MSTLDRLLFADIKRMLSQGLAIAAVLACGVATFVMSTSTHRSLVNMRAKYYRDYRFADVFVQLKRAPNQLAIRLREIPGVARVETRVVRGVILDIPGMKEPATGRLVSIPDHPRVSLNAVHLRQGRLPNPMRRGEVIASEPFAEAHRLHPGSTLDVIMGGRKQRLRIVGIGLSPEYIYAFQPGQFLPDDRHFGVLWMPYRQMAAAFNMEGAFNDASLTLLPGASARDVLFHVDRLTKPYGSHGGYLRKEQPSHRRIADEMMQLKSMAVVMPTIFLAVSAFLFNLVLSRMVHNQQEQIATLRAFGYTSREMGWHYFKLLFLLVVVGTVVGTGVGVWLSRDMTRNYVQFFRFPILEYTIAWDQVASAALLSLGTAVLGGVSALRRAIRLPPAVAMRPEAPASYRPSLIERLGLGRLTPPVMRMIFRQLERNFRSSAMSVLGMSLGIAILVLGSFFEDTINYVMDVMFYRTQRQNVTLTFNEAVSANAVHDVKHLPGVTRVERFRAVAVRLKNGRRSKRMSIMGLERDPQLFRLLDSKEKVVTLASNGLTISEKLGEILDVQPGDELVVEFLEEEKEPRLVRVSALFPNFTEPTAYMQREELHRLLQEGERLNGVFLTVDPNRMDDLFEVIKETPAIAGNTITEAAKKSFEQTLAENLRRMRTVNAIFAAIIAFGVMYNCALIALSERSRDLATLRVLGFTRREVSGILLGELAVITFISLPIGLLVGYGLSYLTVVVMDTETQRFPLVIQRATFAYATCMILATAAISALVVRRMLDRLDLIAVLKVKE